MIKVEHLTKYYGDFLAVDDLSFEIDEGHVYGFLGPNGAGKTTTMNIMTGYLPTSYGSLVAIFIMGVALVALGVFISCLTDNQGLAAGIVIAVILFNYYSVSLSEYVSSTSFGSAVALALLALALGAVVRYLTRNEWLAWGVSFVLLAAISGVALLQPDVLEGLCPKSCGSFPCLTASTPLSAAYSISPPLSIICR